MHSISPYGLKCYDKNKKTNKCDGYLPITNINGVNLHNIIKEFILSNTDNYQIFEENQQVFRFSNVKIESEHIYCWIEVGYYGTVNDIIDVHTGQVSYQKTQNNAVLDKYYLHFYIEKPEKNKKVALMFVHNYGNSGVKSLFYSVFKVFFKQKTNLNLNIFPFAHRKAVQAWLKASVKTVKMQGFKLKEDTPDSADALNLLSTGNEIELSIKAPRNGVLGTLENFINKENDKHQLLLDLSPISSTIKVEAEMNGSHRTFSVYSSRNSQGRASYDIEIDDDIEIDKNMPTFESISTLSKQLINDFIVLMY